jgi:PleD family two-component response regulator
MREPIKNLNHILISRKDEDLVPAFTLGETDYLVYPRVPAEAIVRLTTSDNQIVGMRDYIAGCLGKEEQRQEFLSLMDQISIEGLGEIVEEIVAKTTPFDGKKPSA